MKTRVPMVCPVHGQVDGIPDVSEYGMWERTCEACSARRSLLRLAEKGQTPRAFLDFVARFGKDPMDDASLLSMDDTQFRSIVVQLTDAAHFELVRSSYESRSDPSGRDLSVQLIDALQQTVHIILERVLVQRLAPFVAKDSNTPLERAASLTAIVIATLPEFGTAFEADVRRFFAKQKRDFIMESTGRRMKDTYDELSKLAKKFLDDRTAKQLAAKMSIAIEGILARLMHSSGASASDGPELGT